MRKLSLSLLLTIIALSSACGHDSSKKKKDVFRPSPEACSAQGMLYYPGGCYRPTGIDGKTGRFSLLPYPKLLESLKKDTLNVCLFQEGFSAAKVLEVETNFEKAFNVWQAQIADLTSFPNYKLNFTSAVNTGLRSETDEAYFENCDPESDLKISLQKVITLGEEREDREHARFFEGEMFLNQSTSYQVILHEMGHLFGLADIYVEDVWNCKEGFSNSVMCDDAWQKPVWDDIEAVRRSYCLASDGENEKCFNHEKSGILSFVPHKIKQGKNEDFGTYLTCSTTNAYFGLTYNIVSMARRASEESPVEYASGRFYSTDEESVRETFEAGKYTVKIKTAFSEVQQNAVSSTNMPRDIIVTLEGDQVSFNIDWDYNGLKANARDCRFDTKFLDLLASKGVNVDAGIKARLPYQALADVRNLYESVAASADDVTLNFSVDSSDNTDNLEIKIFADDEQRTLVKTLKSIDLTLKQDGTLLEISLPKDLGLKAGVYHVFLDKMTNTQLIELTLKEAPAETSVVTETPATEPEAPSTEPDA